jgi:predicted ATPase
MARVSDALTLYQDLYLTGFSLSGCAAFEEWLLVQRERFGQLVAASHQRLARYHEGQGELTQALEHARRWVEIDPWQEQAHRQVMRLLAAAEQRGAALAQYDQCRQVLLRELRTEPELETTNLYRRIRDGMRATRQEAPGRSSGTEPDARQTLPTYLTPLIGRERELAQMRSCLQDPSCRLLTVFGPGGAGKTHLTVEAARAQQQAFAHGVCFVPLDELRGPEAIAPALASALGFARVGDPGGLRPISLRDQLLDHLRQKQVLLVLDSFEHMLGGVEILTDLLKRAPSVKAIVTSRTRLNVHCEQLIPIAGLDYPDREVPHADPQAPPSAHAINEERTPPPRSPILGYGAVQLFLSLARRTRPGFVPTAADLEHIARICRLAQGMPLAILLAAAWIDVLLPAEIAAEMAADIGFLETRLSDVPERQRSIRRVFDRSWRLVQERQREVFLRLSVFRGSFAREAAAHVAGASLRQIQALVDRSLLQRTPTGRYQMHDLLRQYLGEKLAQVTDRAHRLRDQHCAYYAAALERWTTDLKSVRQQVALVELDAELDNARAAWRWAIDTGQGARLEQMIEGLCLFHRLRLHCQEGEQMCQMVADRTHLAAPRLRAGALAWQSCFARLNGHT